MKTATVKKNGLFILTGLSLGLLLLLSRASNAAIQIDTTGTSNSQSSSVTIASNSNIILFGMYGTGNFNTSCQCTWNGGNMVIDDSRQSSNDDFCLNSEFAPDTGTHTLSCGNAGNEAGLSWVVAFNAAQENAESTCNANPFAKSFTCTPGTISSGSILVGGFKMDRSTGGGVTAGTGLTLLTSSQAKSESAYGVGATAFSMSGALDSGSIFAAVGSYKESGAPPAVTFVPTVMIF